MVVSFTHYSQIKDNYCICYFGNNKECAKQLIDSLPSLQSNFPDLNISISIRDDYMYLAENNPKVLSSTAANTNKRNFAHLYELTSALNANPVEQFLESTIGKNKSAN